MNILTSLLTLPGNGVFTVHTGKEKKEKLLKSYYGTTSLEKALEKWRKSFSKINEDLPFVLGVPSDNGGGIQRGANWGPLILRQELLSVKEGLFDLGDVRVIPHLLHDKYLNPAIIKQCQKALYGKVNKLPVSPLSIAEYALDELYAKYPDARVLGLGGDHSCSYPLVRSWLRSRKNLEKAGLLHFDAHTDLMDRRLGIDLCFGTWTFHILEDLYSEDHILQLGIRSSGKKKKQWKEKLGVEQYWATEMNQWGVEKTYKKIVTHFKKVGVEELYLSFDIDALDIKYAGATGTPESGGLTPPQCAGIIGMLKSDFNITGADIMEVAPFICPEGVTLSERESSLQVAGDISRLLLRSLKP